MRYNFWINLALAVLWCMLFEAFSPGAFAVGFAVGALVLWFSARLSGAAAAASPTQLTPSKLLALARLAVCFAWEMIVANFQVAWVILRPRLRVQPALIRLPLELKRDSTITALADMITLTPGTLSVDVTPDRRWLIIHCLNVPDIEGTKRGIKERFEAPLKELER